MVTLHKKCLYLELFQSYSVRMRENADQNNSEQGHFSHSVNERVNFFSKARRWFDLWSNKSYQKTQMRIDGKSAYFVESPLDSFVDVLIITDIDTQETVVDRSDISNKFYRSGKSNFRNYTFFNKKLNYWVFKFFKNQP